jgi:ElaB/YqjD/DUF883 family membrane-anchored ribosome-binding protein
MTMLNSADTAVRADPQDVQPEKEAVGYSDVLRSLRESARVTTDALAGVGYKASAAVKELGDSAYQVGGRAGAQVARRVEAQPMAAALVAAAVGLIVGMLLPRR